MSEHEKTAMMTAIEAPHTRKKACESFKETRATMMNMISAITDIKEIMLAFLSSIRTSLFFGEGVSKPTPKGLFMVPVWYSEKSKEVGLGCDDGKKKRCNLCLNKSNYFISFSEGPFLTWKTKSLDHLFIYNQEI